MSGADTTAANLRPEARLLIESVLNVPGPLPHDLSTLSLTTTLGAADEHRVAPAVYRRIRDQSPPDAWENAFAMTRHQQLIRHMRTRAELEQLTRTLESHGIPSVVAKGPVAADVIWPHPDMREYHDLDLFVRASQFEDALDVLLQSGCTLVDLNWPELAQTMRAEVALLGPLGTPIDLHWHMAVPPELRRAFAVDMEAMLERARFVEVGNGLRVRTFDEIDTVLHLAFHAAQAGASKLMWAGDIHYALQAPGFDTAEFWRRAAEYRISRPVSLVLWRVASALGESSRPDVYAALDSGGAWGTVVRRLSVNRPFPALPVDSHAGGNLIGGARRTAVGSAVATARSAIRIRMIERRLRRRGAEERTLHRDIADEKARRRYLIAVRAEGEAS
jgi:hypothetical protein